MLNPKYKCILAHGSDEKDFVCGLFVFNLKTTGTRAPGSREEEFQRPS